MFQTQVNAAGSEARTLINDAERMLDEANATTGEKAAELKKKGLQMLSNGIAKARELEALATDSARAAAKSTDALVQANPWRSVAVAGVAGVGIGLVLGMVINSK